MRKMVIIFLLLLITSIITATNYGLFIGVNEYEHSSISNLRFAVNDAIEIRQTLIRNGLLVEENTTLLENPTHIQILRELNRIESKIDENSTVYIYFSGHGIDDGEIFYLLTRNSDLDLLERTALESEEIIRINESKAQRVIIILDACYSGTAEGEKSAGINFNRLESEIRRSKLVLVGAGRKLITSTSGNETSQEDRVSGMGFFTKNLIQEIEKIESQTTIGELMNRVTQNVSRETNRRQTTQILGDTEIRIVKLPSEEYIDRILEKLFRERAEIPRDEFNEAFNLLESVKKGYIPNEREMVILEKLKEYYEGEISPRYYKHILDSRLWGIK